MKFINTQEPLFTPVWSIKIINSCLDYHRNFLGVIICNLSCPNKQISINAHLFGDIVNSLNMKKHQMTFKTKLKGRKKERKELKKPTEWNKKEK